MNDLVERLEHFEDHQNEVGDRYGAEVLRYAAIEIRRLTGEVEGRIETETQLVREIDRLKLENNRLRTALKRIEVLDYTLDAPIGDEARLTLACQIADEALKEAEDVV